jgi:two-component system, chemotaxis family, chemotaxis protein CheY
MTQTILAVDDSATVRKFVSVSLEMQGFKVLTACDGMDALDRITKQPVHLVITDLNMPNMDGIELVASLRENPDYQELPIIVLSSLNEEMNKKRLKELGVGSYLQKPFNIERIQYEVAKYLNWVAA